MQAVVLRSAAAAAAAAHACKIPSGCLA
jgi:hypothetical protein